MLAEKDLECTKKTEELQSMLKVREEKEKLLNAEV